MKHFIKSLIPKTFWVFLRRKIIIRKHEKVAKEVRNLVEICNAGKLDGSFLVKKVEIPDDKNIVWQYWAQGLEKNKMPELVSICLESVDKYASGDYRIIRLSDDNISNYLNIPKWLSDKKQKMSIAHYTDILRCMLVSIYGGWWLDVCVFLTGKLPNNVLAYDFFMFQRDKNEKNKKYWENTFAYYFGWDKKFRVNVLNGIMYAKSGNKVISDMCLMLLEYWKTHDKISDYFLFQILFDVYIQSNPQRNCPIMSDCPPHLLRQVISGLPLIEDVKTIKEMTTIHSLNYKNPNAITKLKALMAD